GRTGRGGVGRARDLGRAGGRSRGARVCGRGHGRHRPGRMVGPPGGTAGVRRGGVRWDALGVGRVGRRGVDGGRGGGVVGVACSNARGVGTRGGRQAGLAGLRGGAGRPGLGRDGLLRRLLPRHRGADGYSLYRLPTAATARGPPAVLSGGGAVRARPRGGPGLPLARARVLVGEPGFPGLRCASPRGRLLV
ncbi:MAG: hypothetical protein AVDCRST_MAG05-3692, partial [uncultured Rubrobacteraceae bacterium]